VKLRVVAPAVGPLLAVAGPDTGFPAAADSAAV
jgi:hypothetical protein